MHRQTMVVLLHMCSGFPAKLMEHMIMTSLYDVMRFSHVIEGGKYKKESITEPGDFGCCYYCHLGVSTQTLGS